MDPTTLTPEQALKYAVVLHAVIGFVIGLIPLVLGFLKGKLKLGLIGLACAVVGGALLGFFLSVPAVIIFSWLIINSAKAQPAAAPDPDTEK